MVWLPGDAPGFALMGKSRYSTNGDHVSVRPSVSYLLQRVALGLQIGLSANRPATVELDSERVVFSDDTFMCRHRDVLALISYIRSKRKDLMQRILSGESVELLSPQTDPPLIRVSRRSGHRSYFTLGELWRWRLLRKLSAYPFKAHQSYGYTWLVGRHAAVLADDMGLGKTLQAIAALTEMQRTGSICNALILCPKSLIGVWEAEIKLWASRLCTVALHTSIPARDWRLLETRCHVAITNYEAIRTSRPVSNSFDLVVFDEVHRLKNPSSQNYSAAYDLEPKFAWGLSGTPLENHTGDLTAILHLLDRKRVSHRDRHLAPPTLRSLAADYTLRRPRSVIADELPQVVEMTEMIPLLPEQRRTYDAIRKRSVSIKTIGAWITAFHALRNVCDYDPETRRSAKVDRARVIIQAVRELEEKVVVFSWTIEPLRILYQEVVRRYGAGCVGLITGQTESTTRSSIVKEYQASPDPFVLLCSIRATAEGLTLTAANHVVFINEWWNPSINAQARDRVNRIGQHRTVYVNRLRSVGTVESRLDDLLSSKSALFEEIISRLSGSEHRIGEQPPPELLEVVA